MLTITIDTTGCLGDDKAISARCTKCRTQCILTGPDNNVVATCPKCKNATRVVHITE